MRTSIGTVFTIVLMSGELGAQVHPSQIEATELRVGQALWEVGGLSGSLELFGVTGATQLSDGRVVLANSGSGELLIVRDGSLEATTGGFGEGPGEFRSLAGVWHTRSDSIVAYDAELRRVSVFDGSGTLVRDFRMPEVEGHPVVEGITDDRVLLVSVNFMFSSERTLTGVHRPDVELLLVDLEGRPVENLGRFPGREAFALQLPDGGMAVRDLTFGNTFHAAVSGNWIGWGATDSLSVELRQLGTRATGEIRLDLPTVRPSASDARLVADRELEGLEGPPLTIEGRVFREMPLAERLPAFTDLLGDGTGDVWIQFAALPRSPTRTWLRAGTSGTPNGTISLPVNQQPLDFFEDKLVSLVRDELGVESVVLQILEE